MAGKEPGVVSSRLVVACPLEGLVRQLITEESYINQVYNCLGASLANFPFAFADLNALLISLA